MELLELRAVVALFTDLNEIELVSWVERGWVEPESGTAGLVFREIDVARVRLIHDLRHQMEIAEDTIPTVLSLMDQVYDLRARLKAVLRAVERESREIQERVFAVLSK